MLKVNPAPGKLWRFLQFPVTRILIPFAAMALFAVLVFATASALHLHGLAGASAQLLVGLGAWAIYVACVRFLERRSVVELSLPDMPRQSATGFLMGAALFATTVGILWLCGVYSVQAVTSPEVMLAPFIGALGAALLEELAIRGVLFRIIEESLGTWLALALTALIFGLLHGFNPGAGVVSTAAIALESGLLLASAYVFARNLWLCIGLHCAWNFTEGGVFGASVSGGKGHGLFVAQFQGPTWLSGGQFGPEASLVAVLVCLPATIAFLLLAQQRGHIMAPSWAAARSRRS